jgi:hypothetical protein
VNELAPPYPRDNTFPGEVFLHVAADALNWCRASRADPLPLERLREGYLPSVRSTAGRTPSSSMQCWPQQPSKAGPNRTCWMRLPGGMPTTSGTYALFAAVGYIRAAASQAGMPVRQACRDLAQRPGRLAP